MGRSTGFRIGVTFREADEAHVQVIGPVRREEASRVVTLVRALLEAGARQLVVDLAGAESCDPALTVYLDRERRRVGAQGGWLVVDGSPATMRHDTSTLVDAFRIYRHVRGGRPTLQLVR